MKNAAHSVANNPVRVPLSTAFNLLTLHLVGEVDLSGEVSRVNGPLART